MRKKLETGIILFAAMGFWGMIYPDLCFTQDVCAVYTYEDEAEQKDREIAYADIFTRICEAEPEQIRVKSKFMEFITESKGKDNVVNKG